MVLGRTGAGPALQCPALSCLCTDRHLAAAATRVPPAAEYMVLPASQYSVLDAKRIERLDESTFRCYVGSLRLFSLEVEPVITVSVTVQERGPTVRLLSTKVRAGCVLGPCARGVQPMRSAAARRKPRRQCPGAAAACTHPPRDAAAQGQPFCGGGE